MRIKLCHGWGCRGSEGLVPSSRAKGQCHGAPWMRRGSKQSKTYWTQMVIKS